MNGRRVLVVEDELLLALDLESLLEDAGFVPVGPAHTVDSALQFARSSAVDAALLDVNLHGRTVDEVAQTLRERAVPFALLTGYARENLPETLRDAPLLNKPYSANDVLRLLERILRSRG